MRTFNGRLMRSLANLIYLAHPLARFMHLGRVCLFHAIQHLAS